MQIPKRSLRGFSMLELMVAVVVLLIISAFALPNVMRAFHTNKLRGTGNDFSTLLQQARIRAVEDDRFYSVYILAGNGNAQPQTGFVDIYPQAVNGASGTGGAAVQPGDPLIPITSEVIPQPAGVAPGTAGLRAQFLPPVGVAPLDGNLAASPITFSPNGLPCVPQNVVGGTTCNAGGGPVAYWIFFQNTVNQQWEAVTVTPAGRIQKWAYILSGPGGGSWLRI